MATSYRMDMKIFSQLSNRKLTTNNVAAENSAKIRPRKKPISSSSINKNNEKEKDKKNNEKEREKDKDKDKKDSNSIIKLFNPKNRRKDKQSTSTSLILEKYKSFLGKNKK